MTPLKPSELCIGNLLNYDTGEGIELTVIDWQDLKWLQENPKSFNESHTPVPLTPEILEGFGFEKSGFEMYSAHGFDLCYITTDEYFQIEIVVACSGWKVCPMKHAHTLQNFIHAISGVELVYKQNKTE